MNHHFLRTLNYNKTASKNFKLFHSYRPTFHSFCYEFTYKYVLVFLFVVHRNLDVNFKNFVQLLYFNAKLGYHYQKWLLNMPTLFVSNCSTQIRDIVQLWKKKFSINQKVKVEQWCLSLDNDLITKRLYFEVFALYLEEKIFVMRIFWKITSKIYELLVELRDSEYYLLIRSPKICVLLLPQLFHTIINCWHSAMYCATVYHIVYG